MKVLVTEKISPHRVRDSHGYLICTDCILARTGKQVYTRDECFGDGDYTQIEVDRPSKEVFSPQTLASFENVPITIEHPQGSVTPDNFNSLAVGMVRDIKKGVYDGQDVMMGTCILTDATAIELVETNSLRELSCGYECDVRDCENPYQSNIRGNHIALCEQGRAGIALIQDSKKNSDMDDVFINDEPKYITSLKIAVSNEEKPTEIDEDEDLDLAGRILEKANELIVGSSGDILGTNKDRTNYIVQLYFVEPININPESLDEDEIEECLDFWRFEVWLCKHNPIMYNELDSTLSNYRKVKESSTD